MTAGRKLIYACGALMLMTFVPSLRAADPPSRTLLAVFAHPDDDATIGPLIAHYTKRGVRVHFVFVTSGQQGVTEHAGIPAGAQLAAVRENEARAASKAYGAEPPEFLGEQDGTLGTMKRHGEIAARLRETIARIRPDVIITFGPDGVTGHPDHRAVGNMVSEIYQGMDPERSPSRLYYMAAPLSLTAGANTPMKLAGGLADRYITTVVDAADGLEAAARAQECYKSQYTPAGMKMVNSLMGDGLKGQIPLRRAYVPVGRTTPRETQIFDSLP
jgi:LmbE family N-acetylglucosaminyl deacetylase